jgi:PhnB protein
VSLGSVVGLRIGGAPFFLAQPENNGSDSPAVIGTITVRVQVFVDAFVARAVDCGAEAIFDVRDYQMPWGTRRQGVFRDPFGHLWFVGDKSPLSPVQG